MSTAINFKTEAQDEYVSFADMEEIKKKIEALQPQTYKSESDDLGKLFEALAKAQLEMEVAKNAAVNPFFKSNYADLASVVGASRPYLAKHGLSVVQRVLPSEKGILYLFTRLCHASGQWMESKMFINPPKPDIQTLGSYITYLKRYCYAAMVGVVSSDEDDDGENAMKSARKGEWQAQSNGNITKAQLEVLSQELEGHEEILESVLSGFKISKLSDIPSKSYTNCLNRIREIKRAKED